MTFIFIITAVVLFFLLLLWSEELTIVSQAGLKLLVSHLSLLTASTDF